MRGVLLAPRQPIAADRKLFLAAGPACIAHAELALKKTTADSVPGFPAGPSRRLLGWYPSDRQRVLQLIIIHFSKTIP